MTKQQNNKTSEKDTRINLGKKGENAAVKFLEQRGYVIVDRNWRCPAGEADIIAFDCETLVFFEVKNFRKIIMNAKNYNKKVYMSYIENGIILPIKVYLNKVL